MAYDIVLRGGRVADGSGAEPYHADVAIEAGRIAVVGQVGDAAAATVVDASDSLLFPGFVDAHVHASAVLTETGVQEAMLRQGITTVLLGQDGLAYAPGSPATVAYVARYFAAIEGAPPAQWAEPSDEFSITDLLAYFEGRTPINVATLVPLGNIRHDVLGPDPVAAGDRLPDMLRRVEEGLEQGAIGVSTGLEYVPGGFADLDELAELCGPAARAGAPYVSHLRSYADGVAPGMAEARQLGERTGVRLHVSHYRGLAEPLLAQLEGADVTFDSYPHLYANTILAMKALPPWVQQGGVEETLVRLQDAEVRRRLTREWFPSVQSELEHTILGYIGDANFRWAEGRTVAAAAAESGRSMPELVCELLVACDLVVNCVVPVVGGSSKQDVRLLAQDDRHMGCSDGIYLGSHPHPRGWGAFGRFLGRHTRELGDWTWGQAARHLAGAAAERFGLVGRGVLAPGMVADIAVVDPTNVTDVATYEEPRRLAEGVSHVVVGGTLVLSEGKLTGAMSGRGLRRNEESL